MTATDLFELAGALIASIGGGAALILAFSSWLGKVWASRILEAEKANYARELEGLKSRFLADTERYKTSLKKSEFIFQKEYEAASEFVGIVRSIRPTFAHPDMDWYEACNLIALSFEKHEETLERFLAKHGAVLSETARTRLGRALSLASDGKFHTGSGPDLDPQVNKLADEFYDELATIEKELISVVRGQSSV